MTNQPKVIKFVSNFNRKTLRRVCLAEFSDGTYAFRVRILNRDTLRVDGPLPTWFLKSSFETMVFLYLTEFAQHGVLTKGEGASEIVKIWEAPRTVISKAKMVYDKKTMTWSEEK